jgi:hypothetical protein
MIARSGICQFGLMLVTTIVVLTLSTASHAYTADQEQLCTNDAFRLCSSAIPDVDRVTACMIRNRAQLSPGCRQFFREPAAELTPVRARKPQSIKPRKVKKPRRAS